MRFRSARRQREHAERVALLRRTAHGPVRCGFPGGCTREGCDAHEVLSRARGGSITDPANILILCREHHDWIGDHPAAAAELGVALSAPQPSVSPTTETGSTVSHVSASPTASSHRLSVRIRPAGEQAIADLMAETGATEADVVRAMLYIATGHRRDVVSRIRQTQEASS